jgi:hypothetical protein
LTRSKSNDRNIQNSAIFRGISHVVLGVHVCAALQQNLARIDETEGSGVVKGSFAPADAVKDG